MTKEEMQHTMEFIVEQQAQFASNIPRLPEERTRDTPGLKRLEEPFQLLVQLAQPTDVRLDKLESTTTTLDSTVTALGQTWALSPAPKRTPMKG